MTVWLNIRSLILRRKKIIFRSRETFFHDYAEQALLLLTLFRSRETRFAQIRRTSSATPNIISEWRNSFRIIAQNLFCYSVDSSEREKLGQQILSAKYTKYPHLSPRWHWRCGAVCAGDQGDKRSTS